MLGLRFEDYAARLTDNDFEELFANIEEEEEELRFPAPDLHVKTSKTTPQMVNNHKKIETIRPRIPTKKNVTALVTSIQASDTGSDHQLYIFFTFGTYANHGETII